ncbi:copper amine oxidase N-terminal domain-containing protein [Desulfofalx alkaliphila]|uniref:copper amine oxidase N-terminal domain-containing protein n=1 Tax=Desulfofalx alkaliphila TaxID=105483 RepID=UPI00068CFDF3|nr:copper amine oxidase N-terminal domain-containing protein [Desulfofalx alkaliphila]
MRKKLVLLMMVVLLLFATPAFAIIIPGNGGEGVDTTPARPFPGYKNTNTNPAPAYSGIAVIVDGMRLNPDVPPYIDSNNRTQVPFRAIGEALNCQVTWIEKEKKVVVQKAGFTVEMVIGQRTFKVNGVTKTMDTAPVITKSRTFIPVRYVAEALDCNVNWNAQIRTVEITSK